MPMADESLAVGQDEFVLRRIHLVYFDPGLPTPVATGAFRPTSNDTTGLSVFRERFATAADILADLAAEKRDQYCVARLGVAHLMALGLTVIAEPDAAGPAGHSVIPGLSLQAYHADKLRLKQVLVELAKLASQDIVLVPN